LLSLILRGSRITCLIQLGMAEIFNASKHVDEIKEVNDLKRGGHFRSSLGMLVVSPEKTRFESQDDDEEVILLGRRHFSTNFGWMALVCFVFFVPLFWSEFPMIKVLTVNTAFALTIVWYSAVLFFVIQNFLLWFYNIYIVTNERVVDIDFFGLLYKNINVTQINRIEDVNYSQKGIMAGIFNFGDVIVQTSSEQKSDDRSDMSAFYFEAALNPVLVVKIISQLMEKADDNTKKNKLR